MAGPVLDLRDIVRHRREEIRRLAAAHGAKRIRLFGSVARGDSRADSDLDLLVEMEEGRSLLDRIALKQDLEGLLGIAVDVVTEKALHRILRPRVLDEAVEL